MNKKKTIEWNVCKNRARREKIKSAASASSPRVQQPPANDFCYSIQIENMKTILKVLKIFSSFVSLFAECTHTNNNNTARWCLRSTALHLTCCCVVSSSSSPAHSWLSRYFTNGALHTVCYHGFNLFIFEYFACCHVYAHTYTRARVSRQNLQKRRKKFEHF